MASTVLAGVSVPAFAQDSAPSSAGAAKSNADETFAQEGGLGTIIVTARRREESLDDVPDSITVLSEEGILRSRIEDVEAVALRVPNVSIEQSLSPTSTFIGARGVVSTRNGEPAVALVVDGVQIGSSSEVSQALTDVKSIQVLRGPQGALYGRNAIAGAIIVETNTPSDTFNARAMAGLGLYGLTEASGAVSGPISDKLSFRV